MNKMSRAELEEKISDTLDELALEEILPSTALRYILALVDYYAQEQKMLGMNDIVELYNKKGVRL